MVSTTNILVAVLVVGGLGLFAFAFLGIENSSENNPVYTGAVLENTQENFETFSQAELPDLCETPPGYSEEDWQQHMSHHPDRYPGCL